uniref:Uncharacterized protein n=1 Tax=Lates calcarifer TaxID=8187 RepID=A0A4W6FCD3_LATCA
ETRQSERRNVRAGVSLSLDVDPVVFAIRRGDVEAVNDLAASAPHSLLKENKDGWIPLHDAAYCGQAECLRTLLRAGAAINPPNTYSITPLTVAAQQGQMRALCYLIEKGADVNMQTCDGVTALHEASKNGHKEIVAVLLTKNADANKPTNSGLLPLHIAAQYGHHE